MAWLLLSVAALLAYVALVTLLESFVSNAVGRSALPAVLVAVALAPLLPRVQREVDRWMYGDRRDPARVAGRLGEHLAAGDERGLEGVVAALRSALRLPYAAIVDHEVVVAAAGEAPPQRSRVPLSYAGEEVGQLEVGLRPGERRLSSADAAALSLVATPLAVALGALGLSADLQGSRERLVVAREEERRRLRRDLHDGLGPTLTGVALAADAATNFLDGNPARSRELLESLRRDTRTAIADVRRLVDDLRPPALDEIGLVGALGQRVGQLRWRSDGSALDVRLVAPDQLPALPAAVEVAAYRIATEALLNVARHAGASTAQLRVSCHDDRLEVVVTDDGPVRASWAPGVGLEAMRERAAEVGGRFAAGPTPEGGRVSVSIPFGAVDVDVDDIAVPVEATVTIRVVIADDHPIVRTGLTALLGSLPDFEVVGVAADGRAAVREVVLTKPDVALLDLRMPELDGIAATREIARVAPAVAVLVLTMHDDDDSVFAAMSAGARGYLVKGVEQEDIARAISSVAAGEAIFGPGVAQRVLALPAVAANLERHRLPAADDA